jgi:hypothetical protein
MTILTYPINFDEVEYQSVAMETSPEIHPTNPSAPASNPKDNCDCPPPNGTPEIPPTYIQDTYQRLRTSIDSDVPQAVIDTAKKLKSRLSISSNGANSQLERPAEELIVPTNSQYKCTHTLSGHSDLILALEIRGNRLFSGSRDGSIKVNHSQKILRKF